ncbi:MAG TPA: PQQ-dependent dehydrogenase, methanol/ethanol family [Candidatus Sulfotelmatobacter sp.]|nr:PQQ-dependent dehydrogenase, methanol/ethanol family [Candidatus Sulfotelmatobacter sp.]
MKPQNQLMSMPTAARVVVVLACLVCIFATAVGENDPAAALNTIDLRAEDLLGQPPAANWVSYNGDYSGRRYSSLSQINVENLPQLRAEWVFHARNSSRLEGTPVVVNGMMFMTAANDAFALDAATGRVVWHFSRPVSEDLIDDASSHINRGVGVWRNRVYMETDNAHLLCLDARSGNLIWDVPYADWNKNYGATSAPLVVKDKVLVGTSGGDDGVRGFVAAYDAMTGKLAWRFWTIPAPGEFGAESWPGKLYLHGGGTTWMPGTYDPALNTIYWGTSNPAPDFDGTVRPGDDLYTDCVLALDPDTGKLKWYFQFTPHDLFDYDAVETPVLFDAVFKGEARKLLVHADRNGYVYVLDRTDGKFLSAIAFVEKLNWAKGIDEQGRPIRTGLEPTPGGSRICPGYAGATNWYSPSYSEATHSFYFQALEECENFFSQPTQPFKEGKGYYSTGVKRISGEDSQKNLVAYSLDTGAIAWKYPQVGRGHSSGGTMTTASGLVFFGDDAGSFEAVEAQSGKPLWHFNTGQDMSASPMSYAVAGKQYVAIAAGSDVFSFALP